MEVEGQDLGYQCRGDIGADDDGDGCRDGHEAFFDEGERDEGGGGGALQQRRHHCSGGKGGQAVFSAHGDYLTQIRAVGPAEPGFYHARAP